MKEGRNRTAEPVSSQRTISFGISVLAQHVALSFESKGEKPPKDARSEKLAARKLLKARREFRQIRPQFREWWTLELRTRSAWHWARRALRR